MYRRGHKSLAVRMMRKVKATWTELYRRWMRDRAEFVSYRRMSGRKMSLCVCLMVAVLMWE